MSIGRRLRREAGRKLSTGKADLKGIHVSGKYQMSTHQFAALLNKLEDKQVQFVLENPLPKSYEEIRQLKIPTNFGPQDDALGLNLEWYIKAIRPYRLQVKSFINLKLRFEGALLLGQYDAAMKILEQVNSTICYSQWAINQTILLNEYTGGLKGNKQALVDFQSDEMEGVVKSIAYFQSLRAEKNLPLYRLTEIVNDLLKDLPPFGKEYYSFKLFPSNENRENWGQILKVDSFSSIIDRYQTFLEVCVSISSAGVNKANFLEIKSLIVEMYSLTKDPVLYNILLIHNEVSDILVDESTNFVYQINDLFYEGKYESVIERAKTLILKFPNIVETYQIYALAHLNLNINFENPFLEDSLGHSIIQNIYSLFKKDNGVEVALTNLLKHCYTLRGFQVSSELFEIFCKHHSIIGNSLNLKKIAISYGATANPEAIAYCMSSELLKKHPKFESSTILKIYYNYISKVDQTNSVLRVDVDPFQMDLVDLDILLFQKKFDEALVAIDRLLFSRDYEVKKSVGFNLDHLIYNKMLVFVARQDFGSAITLVATTNLVHNGFYNRLANAHLLSVAKSNESEEISESIYTAILLSQYAVRYQIPVNEIWIAYDNFMFGMGVDRPSELRNHQERIENKSLIYFLKNICTQEVLGKSYNYFETEDDLDNERMAVLGLLCEIDFANFEIYVKELQQLSSNIEIRKGIKQLNESKIYVDVQGIKLATEKDLKETFNRAVEIDSLDIPEIEGILNILGDHVSVFNLREVNNKRQIVATSALDLRHNSNLIRLNFISIFDKIRDMFISNSDYGLDSYISMRIRHGALVNHIRSIFDNNNLVTKRDSDSGEYLRNNFWLTKLDISDSGNQNQINSYFSDFSGFVDQYAGELKNNWVQLNTEQKPTNGFLNYVYSEKELNDLYSKKFRRIKSYEEFFETSIHELWSRTETNLLNIRESALAQTQQKIIAKLDLLNSNVNSQSYVNDFLDFSRTITECKTQFRQEIEKISNWFKKSSATVINDFNIEFPIKTSLSVVRKMHVGYANFTPCQNVSSVAVLNGKFFTHFSDMFRNLFDNILTHCDLDEKDLIVNLEVLEESEKIKIKLSNNFAKEKNVFQLNNAIKDIKDVLENPLNIEIAKGEGGTGYPKINKILRSDLGCKEYSIEIMPVTEDRIFTVIVNFETKHLS